MTGRNRGIPGKSDGGNAPRSPALKRRVRFAYFAPAAKIVTLAGDFNGWNSHVLPLRRTPGALWTATLRLEPGRYSYKFVVNGERWEEDPLNERRVVNDRGSCNSVVEVA